MTTTLGTRLASPSAPGPVPASAQLPRAAVFATLTTLAVHLGFLTTAVGTDEGGYAAVARYWHHAGDQLYGPLFVDRPPGLILVFDLANHLGPYGIRILAALVATGLVAAVGWGAALIGGGIASSWASWVAAALACSTTLVAEQLNGELVASALVALTIAATVAASRRTTRGRSVDHYALLAGLAAMSAPLVKQNFFDGLAFVVVALIAPRRGSLSLDRRRFALRFALGAALPLAIAIAWALAHRGLGALLYSMYGFRYDAHDVFARAPASVHFDRIAEFLRLAAVTGILLLVLELLVLLLRHRRRYEAVTLGLGAAFAVEVVGMVGGENYWPHYLIAIVPTVGIAAGLACAHGRRAGLVLKVSAVAVVLASAVVTTQHLVLIRETPGSAASVARWVRAAARPGDTIVVPSSNEQIIDETGLRPVYPYAWSLIVRTLDPHLRLLRTTLAGPQAPTWVVQWDRVNEWGLDPHARVPALLNAHYRIVARICSKAIWLHDGVQRTLPMERPRGSACKAIRP